MAATGPGAATPLAWKPSGSIRQSSAVRRSPAQTDPSPTAKPAGLSPTRNGASTSPVSASTDVTVPAVSSRTHANPSPTTTHQGCRATHAGHRPSPYVDRADQLAVQLVDRPERAISVREPRDVVRHFARLDLARGRAHTKTSPSAKTQMLPSPAAVGNSPVDAHLERSLGVTRRRAHADQRDARPATHTYGPSTKMPWPANPIGVSSPATPVSSSIGVSEVSSLESTQTLPWPRAMLMPFVREGTTATAWTSGRSPVRRVELDHVAGLRSSRRRSGRSVPHRRPRHR